MAAAMTTSTHEQRRRAVPPARPSLSVVRGPENLPRPRARSRAVYRRRRVVAAALALGTVVLAGVAGVSHWGSTLAMRALTTSSGPPSQHRDASTRRLCTSDRPSQSIPIMRRPIAGWPWRKALGGFI